MHEASQDHCKAVIKVTSKQDVGLLLDSAWKKEQQGDALFKTVVIT